jgi:hypothetical protein
MGMHIFPNGMRPLLGCREESTRKNNVKKEDGTICYTEKDEEGE